MCIYRLREAILGIGEGKGNISWPGQCMMQPISTSGSGGVNTADLTFPDEVCQAYEDAKATSSQGPQACAESHILELWANNGEFNDDTKKAIDVLTNQDVLHKINYPNLKSGLTVKQFSVYGFLGSVQKDSEGKIISAKAMQLRFMGKSFDRKEEEEKYEHMMDFEEEFIDVVNKFEFGSKLFGYPNAGRSYADISGDDASNDVMMLMAGFLVVGVYVLVMLGKFNSVQQRAFLSLVGIASVVMGLYSAYGVCAVLGFQETSMISIIPFLLLGIGIDDMFVIVQSFDTLREEDLHRPLIERFGICMKHAGVRSPISLCLSFNWSLLLSQSQSRSHFDIDIAPSHLGVK